MIRAILAIGLVAAQGSSSLERGRELLRAGRFEQAAELFSRAVGDAPDSAEAHYYLGVARMRLGDVEKAIGPLETAARLGPNPAVLYELGGAYLALDRFREAEAVFRRGRDSAPHDPRFRVQLGYAYYQLVEAEKSETELEAALEIAPEDPLGHYYLGLARAALGKLEGASESFSAAVALAPQMGDALVALGRTLSSSGRDDDARAALERALALEPGSVSAHTGLGQIALRSGDRERAIEHFERALELEPGSREASYNLDLARAIPAAETTRDVYPTGEPAKEPPRFELVDATAEAGIAFTHENGASGRRYTVEFAGGGVVVLDYDADGRPDLFFVNGAPLPGDEEAHGGHALFRNVDGRRFENVTAKAGLGGATDVYGMGGAAADVDNDGDVDLVVTTFGTDRLYRNRGDGTFTAVEDGLGTASIWTTSAAFLDADADGFVDLYTAGYLDYTLEDHRGCVSAVRGIPAYCHPEEYEGAPDTFYRNRGDGSFEVATSEAGLLTEAKGKGLGVVVADYDDDGDPDLYVANDTTPNFLFRNDGRGAFREVGLESGVAFNGEGLPEAGMGTDFGDYDRDGRLDLVVTNFDFETNTLYRNLGDGFFHDATATAGLGDQSLTELGFGSELIDIDNDGWLDLVVVNGHILDNIAAIQSNLTHAQHGQLFWNRRGRFVNVTDARGGALAHPRVGRGLASLDVEGDLDLDLIVVANGGAAELIRNDAAHRNRAVVLRLVGTRSNRDGIGARLTGSGVLEELRAGTSYLAVDELILHVGLGAYARAENLVLRWPSGREEPLPPLRAGESYVVKEGVGILEP